MAKELKWNGLTESEIKAMDFDAFVELLPSRRRRSVKRCMGKNEEWKLFFRKVDRAEKNIKTHVREIVILPKLLGLTINVYTGREFVPVVIDVEKLGHCLGEFALSRKTVSHSGAGVGSTRSSKAATAR